jgi:phospholipase/carboxylesterase
MDTNNQTIDIGGWVIRMQEPEGNGPFPVFLLLHGWTGDENSMWIFSSRLPANTLMIAPRGIYDTPIGGYGWYPIKKGLPTGEEKEWPKVDDFRPAVKGLSDILTSEHFPKADFSELRLVGFSQGAALAYTFTIIHPEKVVNFAGLAGFMPEEVEDLIRERPLVDKSAYVTHGIRDDLVPISKARRAVELLEKAGAKVTYCEDDVGHKLSATCFRGMQNFFAAQF